jgi:hypothetical protein
MKHRNPSRHAARGAPDPVVAHLERSAKSSHLMQPPPSIPPVLSSAPPVIGSVPPALSPSKAAVAGDATGGMIPYKNPSALTSYYLGLFSLFPAIGLLLGIAAIVLGIRGIKYYKRHPQVRGIVHAWIGICSGTFFPLIQLLIVLAIIGAGKR